MRFETLESRQLLSITLPAISNVTVDAGTTIYVPLSGTDSGHTISYNVTASDYSKVTAVMMPSTNKTLRFTVNVNGTAQTMDFQLFDNLAPATVAKIEEWVNAGYYNGLKIYRNYWLNGSAALIQGGNNPPSGSITTTKSSMAEEFSPNLQYTTTGMLGMARTATPGTSSSEFFITESGSDAMRGFLDYEYTIFGVQTSGFDVVSSIAAMATDGSSAGYLQTYVTITSATIITDNQGGVLQISAPTGTTGSVTITVTASDDTGTSSAQSFTATITADTATVTDAATDGTNPFSSKIPTTPTSVAYTGSGTTVKTNHGLEFLVSGVTSGNVVQLLCDGNVIGQATATGTTVTITTDNTINLADGTHKFTAIQVAEDQTVSLTENSVSGTKTADVYSYSSTATTLAIDTFAPVFSFQPGLTAAVGVQYQCQVVIAEGTGTGVTYALTEAPSGMTIEAATGLISWTPTSSVVSVPVTIRATDTAGNTSDYHYSLNNTAPVLDAKEPSLGTTDEDTAKIIALSAFINGANGTTITDADTGNTIGGIALIGTNGAGTWAYSLDGTTFTDIGSVSSSTALLLPATASLRFTPTGYAAGTAKVTYRAWDASAGLAATRVDLTGTGATGGSTAYSAVGDAATLDITELNDAPELTSKSPSLGAIDSHDTKTIALTFINNGTTNTVVTDHDSGDPVGGIALIAATGSGTWKYSIDGGTTYFDVGTVSGTSALLLPKTAKLQYVPVVGTAETPKLTFRAWDTTSGVAGTKVDASATGGITAFSAATEVASLTVTANTAPVLTAKAPQLGDVAVSNAITVSLATFINNGTNSTTIADTDASAVTGGIAVVGLTGSGTWAYTLDGTTFTNIGTVSGTSALLLPKTAKLRYTSGTTIGETPTVTYRAWDTTSGANGNKVDVSANGGITAFSTATDTASLIVGTCSISGYVCMDADNDGVVTLNTSSHMGVAGVVVTLSMQASSTSSTWTTVATTMTGADGSFSFTGLAAGTYRIQETQPMRCIDGREIVGSGATNKAVGQDSFDLTLAVNGKAVDYIFGERGVKAKYISAQMFMASSYMSVGDILLDMNSAPVVDLAKTVAGTGATVVYEAGSSALILAANASLTDADSSTAYPSSITGITATFVSRPDGASEVLAATTTGTSIAATYDSASGVLTLSGTDTIANYLKVLKTISYRNTATAPQLGSRSINVVVNDGIDSSNTAVASVKLIDTTAPTGYSITPTAAATNAATTGFTFAGAQVGATFRYTVKSSGGDTQVTGTGTITSATQAVTDIDISGLSAGTLTFSVWLKDTAGNEGAAKTTTATLDRTAPTGYSITATPALTNGNTIGFTFAGAEVGTTYRYTIDSTGGGTQVTGTGTITLAAQALTGINISGLSSGTLNFSVTLTDPAGNVGTAVTATATLDRVAPSNSFTITPDVARTNVTTMSITLAEVETGTTCRYTISSSGGGTTISASNVAVDATTRTIAGINVGGLPDGTLTFTVYVKDAAGNESVAGTKTIVLDRVAPSSDFTVNSAAHTNVTTTSITLADVEAGTTCRYTIISSGGGTSISATDVAVDQVTKTVTNINLAGLADGTLTFTVYVKDAAGNESIAGTRTIVLDRVAPSSDFTVNSAAYTNETTTSITLADVDAATTCRYTIISSGGGTSISATDVAVDQVTKTVTNINLAGLADGTLTFTVYVKDAAGNESVAGTKTIVLDRVAPSSDFTVNSAAYTNETTTSITLADVDAATTCRYTIISSGGGTSISATDVAVDQVTKTVTNINLAGLADGTLTFTVYVKDAAGNESIAGTRTIVLDRVAPSSDFTVNSAAHTNVTTTSITLADVEAGTTCRYTIISSGGGTSISATDVAVDQVTKTVTNINLAGLADGTLTFTVYVKDAAGNESIAGTRTIVLDRVAPSSDFTVNSAAYTNETTTSITLADVDAATTCRYTIISSGGGTSISATDVAVDQVTKTVTNINLAGLADGTLTFTVYVKDAAGNESVAGTKTIVLDRVAPSSDFTVNSAAYTNETTTSITLADVDAATTCRYTIISSGGGTSISATDVAVDQVTKTVTNINLAGLADGTLTFTVYVKDAAGNESIAGTRTIVLDRVAPSSDFTVNSAAYTNETTTSITLADVDAATTCRYTIISSGGGTSISATDVAVDQVTKTVTNINLAGLADGTLTFTVYVKDAAGNESVAGTKTIVLDRVAPSSDFTVNSAAHTNVTTTSITLADVEAGTTCRYTIISSGGGTSISATDVAVDQVTKTVTNINLAGLADGTLTFTVYVKDAAGNESVAGTKTIVLDRVAPTFSVAAGDDTIDDTQATSTSFQFADAETGTHCSYEVTSTGGGTAVTLSGIEITSPTQEITSIDVSSLGHGTLTYKVTLTDLAGNYTEHSFNVLFA